jgi:hypothetical protein
VSTDIELLVLSDRRIDSVRATGLHRVEIDGTRAKISVTPWSGPLAITAQLEGNKTAHATAAEGGPHEVVLTLDARPTPPTTAPTARHTGAAPAHTSLDINTAR